MLKKLILDWARSKGFKIVRSNGFLVTADSIICIRFGKSRFADTYHMDIWVSINAVEATVGPKCENSHEHIRMRLENASSNWREIQLAMDMDEPFDESARTRIVLKALDTAWEKHLSKWFRLDTLIEEGVKVANQSNNITIHGKFRAYLQNLGRLPNA